MKASNVAAALYAHIGGTAEHQAFRILMGWEPDKKPRSVNKPSGSKLRRQLARGTKGLACNFGTSIPVKKK